MSFKLVLSLLIGAVAGVFIAQNTTVVEIRFLFWTVSMSRALLIVVLLATGAALAWLLQGYLFLRRRK
ncbi:MAG TPA: LapA family protein [Sulfuricaulis sp.]|nr:LapA family protein [Sulfuricaulis sp.]